MPRKGPLEEPPPQGKEDVAVSCWVVEELEEVLRLDQEAMAEVPVTLKLPTEDLLTDLPRKSKPETQEKPHSSSNVLLYPPLTRLDHVTWVKEMFLGLRSKITKQGKEGWVQS